MENKTKEEILEKHSCTAIMTDEDFYFESEVIKAMGEYANQEKEKEAIAFLDSIRDYLHESHANLWTDERTSEEFYQLYKQQS